MAFTQKDMSGALFKNDKKTLDTHPLYKGSITIRGEQFWLSAWLNKSDKGEAYMSLSAQPKEAAKPAPRTRNSPAGEYEAERRADAARAKKIEDMDDEIPF